MLTRQLSILVRLLVWRALPWKIQTSWWWRRTSCCRTTRSDWRSWFRDHVRWSWTQSGHWLKEIHELWACHFLWACDMYDVQNIQDMQDMRCACPVRYLTIQAHFLSLATTRCSYIKSRFHAICEEGVRHTEPVPSHVSWATFMYYKNSLQRSVWAAFWMFKTKVFI